VECPTKSAALRGNIGPPGMARRSLYVAKRALAPLFLKKQIEFLQKLFISVLTKVSLLSIMIIVATDNDYHY
jgi:hypothetical protein